MSDEDRQAIELADELEALRTRYPAIPPNLKDEVLALATRLRASPDRQLRKDVQRVIGQTHLSIRDHQDETDTRVARVQAQQVVADDRVAGVREDMTGMQAEQDLATESIAAITAGLAALVEVHTAKRLNKLEQRADDIVEQVRGIEAEVAHLLRAREQGEATASHTG